MGVTVKPPPPPQDHVRPHRRWTYAGLFALRALWAMTLAAAITSFILWLPLAFIYSYRTALDLFLAPLAQLGWSPLVYASWFPAVQAGYVLLAFSAAVILAHKGRDEWLPRLCGLVLVFFGTTHLNITLHLAVGSGLPFAFQALQFMLLMAGANIILLTFPTGKLFPRWSGWLIPLTTLVQFDGFLRLSNGAANGFHTVIAPLLLAGMIGFGAQTIRFRTRLSPAQRQQIKWVLVGVALILVSMAFVLIIDPLLTPLLVEQPIPSMFYRMGLVLFCSYLPFSIAVLTLMTAVLRDRLWEIDFRINRALGYVVASMGAMGVLIIGLALLQPDLADPVLGIFILSLIILYTPMRRLVQRRIDRSVYGLRYPVDAYLSRVTPVLQTGKLTGKRIGVFVLMDFLGRGSMSEVYKSFFAGEPVAVKVIRRTDDRDEQRRFEREAETIENLDHPNIIKLIRYGSIDEVNYLVTRFVEGETLQALLDRQKRLPLASARTIARDIAEALDHVHQQGVIHRDLKPSNIMIMHDNWGVPSRAVIMDFGFAKMTNSDLSNGATIGTIDYMAPEQIQSSSAITGAADIYSLGVVLYEMLTGVRPFQGTVGQVLFAHLKQPAPDPRSHNPELPSYVAPALMRALAKTPEDRFPTACALIDALEEKPNMTGSALRFV